MRMFAVLIPLVDALKLDEMDGVLTPGSSDLAVALLELESRAIILWGKVLEKFLRAYLSMFPHDNLPLDDAELEERFKVVFDEGTQPLTRHLLKTALKNEPGLSLAQLAARRYRPNTASFRRMQRHMLRSIVYPMRDVGLWSVAVEERILLSGQ